MTHVVGPGATIGIVGGGQLGRMLAMAAAQLGYRTHIFAPERNAVAADVAHAHIAAAYDDVSALNGFAQSVDVVTFEFENVPVDTIRHLAEHRPVAPGPKALAVAQDRIREKAFASECGIPVGSYEPVTSRQELADAMARLGGPAILKTAREGYDGKGQVHISDAGDAAAAWDCIGTSHAVVEAFVDFVGEASVLLARGGDGAVAMWDCPQNVHQGGILASSTVPAQPAVQAHLDAARGHAMALAQALDYVGVMACEFFITADGPLFNEFAPRVHNSGHWTIEGAVTSQFENHIRAICGLPLGGTALVAQPVVMHNLVGDAADGWADYLADPACKLHLYGKGQGTAGRKMGHATWVGTKSA